MLYDLLKTLDEEQKANWPLHLSSLVFAYNAMPHSVTGYEPYELMFGHKAPTVCINLKVISKHNSTLSSVMSSVQAKCLCVCHLLLQSSFLVSVKVQNGWSLV